MSKYIGDFKENAIFNCKFSTVSLLQVPTTLSGSPVIKCYKAGETGTETATGLTLTVDFDSVTGLNNIKVDTTDVFYATGNNYSIVITNGTVDSISVVGLVVKEFSIENRSNPVNNSDGVIDANIKYVNDIEVGGVGTEDVPWNPA